MPLAGIGGGRWKGVLSTTTQWTFPASVPSWIDDWRSKHGSHHHHTQPTAHSPQPTQLCPSLPPPSVQAPIRSRRVRSSCTEDTWPLLEAVLCSWRLYGKLCRAWSKLIDMCSGDQARYRCFSNGSPQRKSEQHGRSQKFFQKQVSSKSVWIVSKSLPQNANVNSYR